MPSEVDPSVTPFAALESFLGDNPEFEEIVSQTSNLSDRLKEIAQAHRSRALANLEANGMALQADLQSLMQKLGSPALARDYATWATDFLQRHVIFTDTLRQRGNNFIDHTAKGQPPLLAFDFDVVVDGATLDRPVNYSLVYIKPRDSHPPTREDGRPYVIIDPRAGQGSGIGGFKDASEVGCALHEGHPVYFVIFAPMPIEGQTLADVCAAEAHFVRAVRKRHPDAPHPIIIGNCQGGWGAMLLAATNPDITGPIVANGTPLSYWAGEVGNSMMRYLGGVHGAMVPIMLLSDLGNGVFDGANLVNNFESLNPALVWWTKYYDTFAHGDDAAPDYLEFERWWSGYCMMNEAEIRWILENLFVGNKLARGQAMLDATTHIDLRKIRSPIIIFCSHGDRITPPEQALYWILDNYRSVQEIKARGQRILYTLHPDIGHLGIFVSSTVANKEHREIVSTLKTIEALAPGLYEMVIEHTEGEGEDRVFTVSFEERGLHHILALGDGTRDDERAFGSVSRLEQLNAEIYDVYIRPFVKSMVTEHSAQAVFEANPLRQRRYFFSDKNPLMAGIPAAADMVRSKRVKAAPDNPFLHLEKMAIRMGEQWLNMARDMRQLWTETAFYLIHDSIPARQFGASHFRFLSDAPEEDLSLLPEVQRVLDNIDQGRFPQAVVRILVALAIARGSVRRERLERSNRMMTETEPFASLKPKHRTRMIHEQSVAVTFDHDGALAALPKMMPNPAERARAVQICLDIAGPAEEMDDNTRAEFGVICALLGVDNPLTIQQKAAE